jgi:hypothetical protein
MDAELERALGELFGAVKISVERVPSFAGKVVQYTADPP